MKYLISMVLLLSILAFDFKDDFYALDVKTLDGHKLDLLRYKGKKVVFIILPTDNSDTVTSFSAMAQLQSRYQQSLVVIGVPGEETGYKKGDEVKIKKMFTDASGSFILTQPMKVKKGGQQSMLFQWLTSKERNRHFDQDVPGAGTKFFVDEGGELYAVMGPQLGLRNPIIDKIITRAQGSRQ